MIYRKLIRLRILSGISESSGCTDVHPEDSDMPDNMRSLISFLYVQLRIETVNPSQTTKRRAKA